ncbi:F-box/kelch-repeat protein At3g06240-like [Vicia villosa]|uniref:F-box/kelch-repeat protein At3g06240-like n=1 Tax=Vicia villosa TaxID=3911 RepID=UPI00273AF93B|nr:F-box/kelch-repeat protein At3g06240-like [Vicia villosa]
MYLPHELIIQILLRLPVKSLIRFKSVCKLWFSLISHDPHFANSHFQLNAATHKRRILFISTSAPITRSIDLEAPLHDEPASTALSPNFIFSLSYLEIKGSCNGFIYLNYFGNMCLWNPSTGIHVQIPLSPVNSSCFGYLDGFGYDHSTDDYLIVSMCYNPALPHISSHLQFFSFRANTWKKLEATYFPYMNASHNHRVGSLLGGVMHWLAFRRDIPMNVIVAFDLTERKLLEMSLPDDFNTGPSYCDLWVFGEFLSLWSMGKDIVEIWVMKEYKVRSSWTMTLVLPIHAIPTRYFSPICCTNRGDIIGTYGSTGLVKYDDKGQLLEHLSYGVAQYGSQVAVYVESLLSLPVDSLHS